MYLSSVEELVKCEWKICASDKVLVRRVVLEKNIRTSRDLDWGILISSFRLISSEKTQYNWEIDILFSHREIRILFTCKNTEERLAKGKDYVAKDNIVLYGWHFLTEIIPVELELQF